MKMRLLLIPLIFCPFMAGAEGARLELSCDVATRCDQMGICSEVSGDLAVTIEPTQTGADGAGAYDVSFGAETYSAQGNGRLGPFFWSPAAGQSRALTITSESSALMILQDMPSDGATAPVTRVDFLKCEVTY